MGSAVDVLARVSEGGMSVEGSMIDVCWNESANGDIGFANGLSGSAESLRGGVGTGLGVGLAFMSSKGTELIFS